MLANKTLRFAFAVSSGIRRDRGYPIDIWALILEQSDRAAESVGDYRTHRRVCILYVRSLLSTGALRTLETNSMSFDLQDILEGIWSQCNFYYEHSIVCTTSEAILPGVARKTVVISTLSVRVVILVIVNVQLALHYLV